MDLSEVFTAQVRGLQAIHAEAHRALLNWGLWSRDRRGMSPTLQPSSTWDEFKRSEVDDYGEEAAAPIILTVPAKPEYPELPPYDEKAAIELDERLHGPGGLALELRRVLQMAYVTREIPETQFARLTGCPEHAFRERLETGLLFVARFVGVGA